jgi:hypothetical protein
VVHVVVIGLLLLLHDEDEEFDEEEDEQGTVVSVVMVMGRVFGEMLRVYRDAIELPTSPTSLIFRSSCAARSLSNLSLVS